MFECASWVILLVDSLAVWRWTNRCLPSGCAPKSDVLYEVPFDRLASDLSPPRRGVCVSRVWWCEVGEEDDNEQNWEVMRNI